MEGHKTVAQRPSAEVIDPATVSSLVTVLATAPDSEWAEVRKIVTLLADSAVNDESKRAMAQVEGCLSELIRLATSDDEQSMYEALRALRNLAVNVENKALIADAGDLSWLFRVLATAPKRCKEQGAALLANLSLNGSVKVQVAESAEMETLVRVACFTDTETWEARLHIMRVLSNVSTMSLCKGVIIRMGGVEALMNFLDNKPSSDLIIHTLSILTNIVSDASAANAMVERGIVLYAMEYLGWSNNGIKRHAATLLAQLSGMKECLGHLARPDAVKALLDMCNHTVPSFLQSNILRCLANIASHDHGRRKIISQGGISIVKGCLETGQVQVQTEALVVLARVSNDPELHELISSANLASSFVSLCTSATYSVQTEAAAGLAEICQSEMFHRRVLELDGLQAITHILQGRNDSAISNALRALGSLARNEYAAREILRVDTTRDVATTMVESKYEGVTLLASKFFENFALNGDRYRAHLLENGPFDMLCRTFCDVDSAPMGPLPGSVTENSLVALCGVFWAISQGNAAVRELMFNSGAVTLMIRVALTDKMECVAIMLDCLALLVECESVLKYILHTDGVISCLSHALLQGHSRVNGAAVKCLSGLLVEQDNRTKLMMCDVAKGLCDVLSEADRSLTELHEDGLHCLASISIDNDGKRALLGLGIKDYIEAMVSSKYLPHKQLALTCIANMAVDPAGRDAMAHSKFIMAAISSLTCGDQLCMMGACRVLQNLAGSSGNQILIARHGALEILVDILCGEHTEVQIYAAGAIGNIAADQDNAETLKEMGAEQPLKLLAQSNNNDLARQAMRALKAMDRDRKSFDSPATILSHATETPRTARSMARWNQGTPFNTPGRTGDFADLDGADTPVLRLFSTPAKSGTDPNASSPDGGAWLSLSRLSSLGQDGDALSIANHKVPSSDPPPELTRQPSSPRRVRLQDGPAHKGKASSHKKKRRESDAWWLAASNMPESSPESDIKASPPPRASRKPTAENSPSKHTVSTENSISQGYTRADNSEAMQQLATALDSTTKQLQDSERERHSLQADRDRLAEENARLLEKLQMAKRSQQSQDHLEEGREKQVRLIQQLEKENLSYDRRLVHVHEELKESQKQLAGLKGENAALKKHVSMSKGVVRADAAVLRIGAEAMQLMQTETSEIRKELFQLKKTISTNVEIRSNPRFSDAFITNLAALMYKADGLFNIIGKELTGEDVQVGSPTNRAAFQDLQMSPMKAAFDPGAGKKPLERSVSSPVLLSKKTLAGDKKILVKQDSNRSNLDARSPVTKVSQAEDEGKKSKIMSLFRSNSARSVKKTNL